MSWSVLKPMLSPKVRYQVNLEYLIELCKLMVDKYKQ